MERIRATLVPVAEAAVESEDPAVKRVFDLAVAAAFQASEVSTADPE